MKEKWTVCLIGVIFVLLGVCAPLLAADDNFAETMRGLQGVRVLVEEMQPGIQKYSRELALTKEHIQRDVETRLLAAGIVILRDNWLKTPGRPVLYVNINTHESEKYWYAYDIDVELKQLVSLEANPAKKALAGTWSVRITGMANINSLGKAVRNDLEVLVGRFVAAFQSANRKN